MLMLRNGIFSADNLANAPRVKLTEVTNLSKDMALNSVLELDVDTNIDQLMSLPISLSNFAAVELVFPSFADGRGFTLARDIREKLDFHNDLRACGHVIPDQLTYLAEVGFNAVLLDEALIERHTKEAWQNKTPRVGLRYQPHTKGERDSAKSL